MMYRESCSAQFDSPQCVQARAVRVACASHRLRNTGLGVMLRPLQRSCGQNKGDSLLLPYIQWLELYLCIMAAIPLLDRSVAAAGLSAPGEARPEREGQAAVHIHDHLASSVAPLLSTVKLSLSGAAQSSPDASLCSASSAHASGSLSTPRTDGTASLTGWRQHNMFEKSPAPTMG